MTEPTTEAGDRPHLTLDLPEADRLFGQLVETTEWRQDSMKMFGQLKPTFRTSPAEYLRITHSL